VRPRPRRPLVGADIPPGAGPRRYFARWCVGSRYVALVRLDAPDQALSIRRALRMSGITTHLLCPVQGNRCCITVPLAELAAARYHLAHLDYGVRS
jgi:hypothetical protein